MNRIIFPLFLLFSLILGIVSCEKEGACDEYKVSTSNSNKSHNFGLNCMQCHQASGEGEGCFSVAGSVRNAQLTAPVTSGQVEFYTGPNGTGTLKYSLEIDSKGNFYTTGPITVTGLYPAVKNANGTIYMGNSLNTGACNSCHGVSTQTIHAN